MKKLVDGKSVGVELPEGMLGSRKVIFQLGTLIIVGLTAWVWFGILSARSLPNTVYILDVGQGDSQLVMLASENGSTIKILIDGGRDRRVLDALDEVLGTSNDKYLDLVILTHADLDHIGGLVEVAKRYDIGTFIWNGREEESEASRALEETLRVRNVPSVALREGDAVRYGDSVFVVLSPSPSILKHVSPNEAGIVMMLTSENKKVLFTADIGFPTENTLIKKHDLRADVLKVGHHGSKNSSGENFIAAVRPSVSVIGVGKNSYGHPTPRVLETLDLAGSRVYRTDEHGTVKILLAAEAESRAASTSRVGFLGAAASMFTGEYKKSEITTISLNNLQQEKTSFKLTSHETCSFASTQTPRHRPVVINEVAWMGSSESATHEWIELQNLSGKRLNVSGWQIVNENERLHFTFPQQSFFDDQFIVLARSAARETLSLDTKFIFTGSLRNTREGLRLFDNQCNLIDEISASAWVAGNNGTKQTMERANDLSWKTSPNPGGTPGSANTSNPR